MNYENIKLDVAAGVATITLNRPNEANGITIPLAKDLLDAAQKCEVSNEVRAVILTGEGKMFCGGGDVNGFLEAGDNVSEMLIEITSFLHAAIARLRYMRAPVIVAVNGTAAGAGLSLAMLGDYVIASEKAKFTMAYTGIGLSPDGSSSHFLPRVIGLRKTQELMLTNRLLTAQEALDWGMLNKVVPPEQLTSEAMSLAQQIAKGPTDAYGKVKLLLNDTHMNDLEAQMDLETRYISELGASVDGKEGVSAFLEKRAPVFKG